MDGGFVLKGLGLGLAIAAVLGPIGLLCIGRTLQRGRAVGLVSGLGAATADALYAAAGGFGLTFISGFLVAQRGPLRLAGGLFLCWLGLRTLLARPVAPGAAAPAPGGLAAAYASTLVLTLSNPLTILSFAAIFAGAGIGGTPGDYGAAALLVAGVFLGSATWWLVLSSAVAALRTRLPLGALLWISRISGIMILGFGVVALHPF